MHRVKLVEAHFQELPTVSERLAFVSEPQANDGVERFFRTLKEQAIYGRIFNNLEEVRAAVDAFVVTDNEDWRLKKLGFLSPIE